MYRANYYFLVSSYTVAAQNWTVVGGPFHRLGGPPSANSRCPATFYRPRRSSVRPRYYIFDQTPALVVSFPTFVRSFTRRQRTIHLADRSKIRRRVNANGRLLLGFAFQKEHKNSARQKSNRKNILNRNVRVDVPVTLHLDDRTW